MPTSKGGDTEASRPGITSLHWSPFDTHIFASACDGPGESLLIWDTRKVGTLPSSFFDDNELGATPDTVSSLKEAIDGALAPPPEVIFSHSGHRASIVDFQWNPYDPWVLSSLSDDSADQSVRAGGGGEAMGGGGGRWGASEAGMGTGGRGEDERRTGNGEAGCGEGGRGGEKEWGGGERV